MAEYNMEPIHLRTHEINYELKIRGIVTTASDMYQKRRFLKRELQKDMARPEVHSYEVPNFSLDIEKKEIEESLKSITTLVDDFDGTNKDVYERIRSRLVHFEGRVRRIPENISEEICAYRGDNLIMVSTLEDELDEIMQQHAQGDISRPSTSTTSTPATSKSFPVHKWNLTFNGMETKTSVNSFLEQVEELSYARNVTKDELFRSAVELFDGPAKVWFRLIRKNVNSWNELVAALKKDFLPKDADDDLWECIRSRKQKRDERVIIFVAAMDNLFERLTVKAKNDEKLKTIKKNLLEEYHIHLVLKDIKSVDQLLEICRALADAGIIKSHNQRSCMHKNISSLEPALSHLPTCSSRSGNFSINSRVANTLRCYKCGQVGHFKRNCKTALQKETKKKNPRCFGCGKEGVIKPNCPNCTKNS